MLLIRNISSLLFYFLNAVIQVGIYTCKLNGLWISHHEIQRTKFGTKILKIIIFEKNCYRALTFMLRKTFQKWYKSYRVMTPTL